jgi:[ribosomal protein S5]-alanine N-acetyltransferase
LKIIFAHILHTYEEPGYGFYAVELNSVGKVIGQCGLLQQDLAGQTEVEIAYKLLPQYWNRGLATEAAQAIRDYGFRRFGFPRVISIVHPNNLGSQRVCEKNGMTRVMDTSWHGIEQMYIYAVDNPNQELLSNSAPY